MKRKIGIMGTGYVGLVTGAGLADMGHEVTCCDVDEKKIEMLKNGKIPIYEPGLENLVLKTVKERNLKFSTETAKTIRENEAIFSAVGTPMGESYEADLRYVMAVAEEFAKNNNGYKLFVNKSTVPVGTGDKVKGLILKINPDAQFDIVSNPEFLKEGSAVKDFMAPERVVVGTETEHAMKIMKDIYSQLIRSQRPLIEMDVRSAELTKYASNAMLATRISFMNQIAEIADSSNADITKIAQAMGLDSRIGPRFLQAGVGYGGSCFPKDVNALIRTAKELGVDPSILMAVNNVNDIQKTVPVKKLEEHFPSFKDKHFAIWGLSFKPDTDDVREAPAYIIAKDLIEKGATVTGFDPQGMTNFKTTYDIPIKLTDSKEECIIGADALLLVTEWNSFRTLDYDLLRKTMRGRLILDGRNIYNPNEVRSEGFNYIGIGRT